MKNTEEFLEQTRKEFEEEECQGCDIGKTSSGLYFDEKTQYRWIAYMRRAVRDYDSLLRAYETIGAMIGDINKSDKPKEPNTDNNETTSYEVIVSGC